MPVKKIIIVSLALVLFFSFSLKTNGATEQELKNQLNQQNSEIADLEKEIADYRNKLNNTKGASATLSTELRRLELSKQKLETDVRLTKTQIEKAKTTIEDLSGDIKKSAQGIDKNKEALAEALRQLNQADTYNLATILLNNDNFSQFLTSIANIQTLQKNISDRLGFLSSAKLTYEVKKSKTEKEYEELEALEDKLGDQKTIVEQNKSQKNSLLSETKAQEKTYQQILSAKIAKRDAVQAEIKRAEEALNLIVNPGALPATGRGVIKWPVDDVVITQYFGNTPFATANAQIYQGKGHNGIDLAAAVGTPIKAVLNGTVIGVGDTDTACKGASYGKWVMVRHPNGLSSVYAHLSLPNVTEGQTVTTGQVVAYSGASGYVTGPHLHFTLLATDGSQVGSLQSKVPGCGVYRLPLASPEAVLNPLSYL